MSASIRVENATKRRVRVLAEATGMKMQTVVKEAIAEYERKVFWDRTNARYAELREDRSEWTRISEEREGESGALRDGFG